MINIVICGINGAMGKELEQEIKTYDNIFLAGILSPRNGNYGQDINVKVDVVIDFSNPSNLDFLLDYAITRNSALLICTTGYTEEQKNKIVEAGNNIPVMLSSNTSLGINVFRKILKSISKELNGFDIDIIEKHHNKKIDSPSGTAKTLAEDIMKVTEREKIDTHALRAGTIPGEHIVIFSGLDEILEIKHTAFSKKIFARGAFDIALKLNDKPKGFYTTEDVF
ncbi:MAG: dapB [Bacillota bacterium]|jgi:4-hydroxy-tetrahydrodipicolinate reductase|nr:dapB [Bacillota bacterium]